MGDPLGLTKTTVVASGSVELLVHPELLALKALKAVAGRDPLAEQRRARSLANSGDEFFALRPYMVGDELRRVHWPASARSTGELIVRQDEKPRTGRVTVILDQQSDHYDEDGFERAVSAALSALYAAWNGEDALRFSTSSNPTGVDLGTRTELNAVDSRLSYVQPLDVESLGVTLEAACRFHGGGTLVVVTGNLSAESHTALARARRAFGRVIVVASQRPIELNEADWTDVIFHDGENDFVEAWRKHLEALSVAR